MRKYMWPFRQSSKSHCGCAQYSHLTLDRKAISLRIKQSVALMKRLEKVAEDSQLGISLFRCPLCGEMWQSGREWNFGNEEYLYRVPCITQEEWLHEHYVQPGALMMYSSLMQEYYERVKHIPSSDKCQVEGCSDHASTMSVFCRRHQIESLQKSGRLPSLPTGRLFPPYQI